MTVDTSSPKRNTLATICIYLGAVGFIGISWVTAIACFIGLAGVVTGFFSLNQIKKSGEKGTSLAVIGIILGFLIIIISALALIGPILEGLYPDVISTLTQ